MTGTTIGKTAAIIGAIFVGALGTVATGRADRAKEGPSKQDAQPAISAPAATSADITALREHVDARFDSQDARLRVVEQAFADVHGYIEAQKQHELERAIAGKRR